MNRITEEEMRVLLQTALEKLGSQKKLAEEIGIAPSYLSNIMNHNFPISEKVAAFFGRTITRVFDKVEKGSDEKSGT